MLPQSWLHSHVLMAQKFSRLTPHCSTPIALTRRLVRAIGVAANPAVLLCTTSLWLPSVPRLWWLRALDNCHCPSLSSWHCEPQHSKCNTPGHNTDSLLTTTGITFTKNLWFHHQTFGMWAGGHLGCANAANTHNCLTEAP